MVFNNEHPQFCSRVHIDEPLSQIIPQPLSHSLGGGQNFGLLLFQHSSQDFPMHIGQPPLRPVVVITQPLMVQTEQI
jgi:hypothetical protein